MKAEMDEKGVITLSPESTVEAYALQQWGRHAFVVMKSAEHHEDGWFRGSALLVNGNLPKDA